MWRLFPMLCFLPYVEAVWHAAANGNARDVSTSKCSPHTGSAQLWHAHQTGAFTVKEEELRCEQQAAVTHRVAHKLLKTTANNLH